MEKLRVLPAFSSLRRYVAQPVVLACILALAAPLVAAAQQPVLVASAEGSSTPGVDAAGTLASMGHPLLLGLDRAAQPAEPFETETGGLQQSTLPNGQQPATRSEPDSFFGHWQARVTATQNRQPHWITPLVTVTPRLEQEVRTDFVHYYNTSGHQIWNYDNGKGLELIPEKHTELLFNAPPFFDRSNGESDGFGDVTFLLKEQIFSRNEEHGNGIVTAFLGASVPTGKNGNGSCCEVVTPTLAAGKGWGNLDLTSTVGGSLPVTNSVGLGRSVIWNSVAQYRLAKTGLARLFWPEFESNATFYKGGSNDGKTQVFGTPGLIIGRIPLSHDANGQPGRLGFTFGAGEEIAMTHFHTANHYTVLTFRIPF